MGKVISSSDKPGFFPKGGSGKMFGKGKVGEVVPGQSGKESQTPPGGGDKFARVARARCSANRMRTR